MGSRRVVGWMDDTEWEAVYYNLYYGSKVQIRTALDVISVWRARYSGRIPVGIEASVQLFESRLLPGNEHCMVKRQSMSAAVSQFVGLLTERKLKGQLYARPMHVRGEELGIPEWVTSLRHDAAHGFIPSFLMLEKGVDFAIEWLQVNHWEEHLLRQRQKQLVYDSKETENLESQSEANNESTEHRLTELLRKYFVRATNHNFLKKTGCGSIKTFMSEEGHVPEMFCSVLIAHNFIPIGIDDERRGSKFYIGSKGQRVQLSSWARNTFTKLALLLQKHGGVHFLLLRICDELQYPSTSVALCNVWIEFLLQFLNDHPCPDHVWAKVISRLIEARANNHVIQKVIETAEFLGDVKYDPNNKTEILEQLRSLGIDGVGSEVEKSLVMHPGAEDDVPSWTLCDHVCKGCSIGLLPGQDRRTLWKSLFCDELAVSGENIGEFGCGKDNTDSRKSIFSDEKMLQFCNDIDLL